LPASPLITLALVAERYLLSLFFLYLAWGQAGAIRALLESLSASGPAVFLPELVKHLLVLILNVLVGSLLLLGRAPVVPPRGWQDVFVPLAANFFYLAWNVGGLLPDAWTRSRVPAAWHRPLAFLALYLGLLGLGLAVWAVAHLGRSFSVLVSVREVVVSGPYRYVRHPIYLSYVLQMTALLVAHGSPLALVLVTGHFALTVYRARLEEERLAAHSEDYRAYRAKTGFLLPRFRPTTR
jgi:protein-S-isoprenylcysteine O-methyltransferase Ste14